jgi:hypothetical protein
MGIETTPQDDKIDVPTPNAENIESSKLEWGADLGEMSWYTGEEEIAKLNGNLSEEEKKWRFPTVEELQAEFKKTNSKPAGFESENYWSGATDPDDSNGVGSDAYIVVMYKGDLISGVKSNEDARVRPVR